ncbi:MAG: MoaD/ThiS family protein [Fuerstiella sp.]|nr:MoaD/ThiS family protein [Fuerstiella sp.]MCP4855985.1 MoaD/ThiS family protein [Fuerstiella sp.]
MAIVFVPPQLRKLTGAAQVDVEGNTVREVVDQLEKQFPGIRQRLFEDDQLSPLLQLSVDHVMTRAVATSVTSSTEVHFLPVIGGG